MSDNNNQEQHTYSHEYQSQLIDYLATFKPSDATPVQFYNCVKEMCLMHNCGLRDGLRKAIVIWPQMGPGMRNLCKSEELAAQPIPNVRMPPKTDSQRGRTDQSSRGRTDQSSKGRTDQSSKGRTDQPSEGRTDESSEGRSTSDKKDPSVGTKNTTPKPDGPIGEEAKDEKA